MMAMRIAADQPMASHLLEVSPLALLRTLWTGSSNRLGSVCKWHSADMPATLRDVCFRGYSFN